ncbi:hypothetical protein S40288_03589 [Stachybotrys chartarum IBT 40288]|nr:hypothetical protein S40288_03589 [Stachybotrys chartarum IBT 40288]
MTLYRNLLLFSLIGRHLPNQGLQQNRQILRRILPKRKVPLPQPPHLPTVLGLGIHVDHARAPRPRLVDVGGRGVHRRRRADHEHQVHAAVHPGVDARQHRPVQVLAEPHHARPLQTRPARRAVRQPGRGDALQRGRRVEQRVGLVRGHVGRCGRERRAEGVVVVAALRPVAAVVGALDVEQRPVQQPQVLRRMTRARRQILASPASATTNDKTSCPEQAHTVDVLRQTQKPLPLHPRQRRQRPVRRVRPRPERHVPPVPVEQPHEARVVRKGARRREARGVVVAPEAPRAPEGRQPGRSRQPRAA